MMKYLGYLQKNDPLYDFMQKEIQPKLNLYGNLDYRVFRLHASNNVFMYEETRSLKRLIGKFYYHGPGTNRTTAHETMEHEFFNLKFMRSRGFNGSGFHYIARPLGKSPDLNDLLMEECCYGEPLSSIIIRSIQNGDPWLLYRKLTALAFFLSRFHNHTALACNVDLQPVSGYAFGILHTLHRHGWISEHRKTKLDSIIKA